LQKSLQVIAYPEIHTNYNQITNVKFENYDFTNMPCYIFHFMSEETKKEVKEIEQEEMKDEEHNLELKEGYEQDEKYEESEE
jgi:hypothetical protein